MAWVASLFPQGSISWVSCTDDQAVLFIEVFRLFRSFCSVQNILYRIFFCTTFCTGQENIWISLQNQGGAVWPCPCPEQLRGARFQARPAHKGESGKPVTAHCRVSLVSTHLHAQKEVRVEAAAGSLTSWDDLITALWLVICNLTFCSKPRHGTNYNPLYFSALVVAHVSQMSYNKCLFLC